MGCSNCFVQDLPYPQQILNNTNPLSQYRSSSQTPKISIGYSSSTSGLTSPTLKDIQSKSQLHEEEYFYTLKSFHIIEKLAENSVYKQFRVINNHTNLVQMMYVIPLTFAIKQETLSSLMQLKEKNLLNIHFVFSDDNFRYIITDLAIVNIYEAVYQYSSFTIDKVKKILRSILIAVNYLYEQNESILRLDYTKIKVLNESFAVKLEYFDLKYLMFYSEESNPIENVLYEIGKVLLVLLNAKKEIPFTSYRDVDVDKVYSSEELLEDYPIELIEIIEVLLSGQEKNISKILSMAYFTNQFDYTSKENLAENAAFYSFFSRLFLYKATRKFLKRHALCKESSHQYESLLENIATKEGVEINCTALSDNLKEKMHDRYISFEMTEIISVLSKAHLSKFSGKQIGMMLADYDTSLYKARLKKAFDLFDEDQTGRVDIDKLKEIFELSEKTGDDGIGEIIEEVDKADDRMITFNEFLYVLTRID